MSNINIYKRKIPIEKESVKTTKKKHNLWKRYIETKEGKYYIEYCRSRNKVRKTTKITLKGFEMKLAT